MIFVLVFEHRKGNHLDAKVMARAPISWLDKWRKYNHLIGYISNSNFQFKTNFCVCRFLLQNVYLKLNNIFVFFVFILVDAFSGSIKTENTKNLFTLAENNFGERKLYLRTFTCGNEMGSPGRAVSLHLACSGSQSEHRIQYILPAHGACHIINSLTCVSVSQSVSRGFKIWWLRGK